MGRWYSDSEERFWKGEIIGRRGQKERMHNEEKGGSERGIAHEEEKRGYKKDEEVTTGQSFREDGNKGKTRQRRQRRHSEGREKEKGKGHQE